MIIFLLVDNTCEQYYPASVWDSVSHRPGSLGPN